MMFLHKRSCTHTYTLRAAFFSTPYLFMFPMFLFIKCTIFLHQNSYTYTCSKKVNKGMLGKTATNWEIILSELLVLWKQFELCGYLVHPKCAHAYTCTYNCRFLVLL